MIIVYYPCYNCIDRKLKYMCGYIDNNMSLVSLYWTSSLIVPTFCMLTSTRILRL